MGDASGRILIADSDRRARELASSALRQAGYEVHEAATAEDAIKAAHEQRPLLVIVDVALPGMTGYDVCRTLRREYGQALPIVLVSGPPTETLDRIGRHLVGVDGALVEAVSPREMLGIIDSR